MMNRLTTILLLLILSLAGAVAANASVTISQDTLNKVDANGKKQGYWRVLANPSTHVGYSPGQVVEEGAYYGNRRIGVWKRFWPNGNLKSEITYKMGRPLGKYTTYYPNGKVEEDGSWELDRNVGAFKRYHTNGKLAQDFNFNEFGLRNGKQKYYHETGQLAVEVDIKDGKEDGTLKRYYANGDLHQVAEFNGGVINSANSKYLKPVKRVEAPPQTAKAAPSVSSEEKTNEAIRFKRNGYNTLYDKELRISQSGEFRDGRLFNGKRYKYDQKGELAKIEMYVEGRYAGLGVIFEEER
jgi:antitoxin component YwqK of YwqJK toxin-antitoxin module